MFLLYSIPDRCNPFYQWFRGNLNRAIENRILESAAAVSFYLIFSLFPFLLLFISIGSYWLESSQVQNMIFNAASRHLPDNTLDFLTENVTQLISDRKTIGIIGIIILVWPSSMAFTVLAQAINRAWPTSSHRGIVTGRIIGILVVAGTVALLAVFFLLQAVLKILAETGWFPFPSQLAYLLSRILLLLFPFLSLVLLYHFVPSNPVPWKHALAGSSVAFVLLETVTLVFGILIDSDLITYSLVYGSLGALIAFMTWLYLLNFSVLLGAYMCNIEHE